MKETFLIVDGSYLLFQSFFGMPNKIQNSKGQYVEAVICFTGILLKIVNRFSPTKLLIVFDGENHLDRKDIDGNYKSNRIDYSNTSEEENPFSQLEIIKTVLNYLHFPWVETTDCEGDDYIASIVNNYKKTNNMIIASCDKDFFQLIDKDVKVFCYRGKLSKLWDESEIKQKYKFSAKYFLDYKALIGDSSDNISGLRGIGPKTATNLILRYGNVNNIIDGVKDLKDKVSLSISSNQDKLRQNVKIIDLKNCKYRNTINDFNFEKSTQKTTEILKTLCLL